MAKTYNNDVLPEEGAKIEYWLSSRISEVDVWLNGKLINNPDDWFYVKAWQYVDKNYIDKVKLSGIRREKLSCVYKL